MERKVLRNISYGMYVVGTKDEKDVGCIVNTLVQITSDPGTIAVSINHDNYTNEKIKKAKKFTVSILKEDTEKEIIQTFGYQSSRDTNKFTEENKIVLDGMPALKNSCGTLLCEVIDTMETSTHTVFLGKILDMENYQENRPMTYRYYQEELKGKSPKNAPTYVEEAKKEEASSKTIWKCSVCGYEVEMDSLPEDFVCPICGRTVEAFKKI